MSSHRNICEGCGAPLHVDDGARYITCNYCGSSTDVQRDQGGDARRLADELHRIRLQEKLHELEREWEQAPRTGGIGAFLAGLGRAAIGCFMLIWIFITGTITLVFLAVGGPLAIIPLGILVFGVVVAMRALGVLSTDQDAPRDYEHRRRALLDELHRAG